MARIFHLPVRENRARRIGRAGDSAYSFRVTSGRQTDRIFADLRARLAEDVLLDLRNSQGFAPALGLPPGPNSSISLPRSPGSGLTASLMPPQDFGLLLKRELAAYCAGFFV